MKKILCIMCWIVIFIPFIPAFSTAATPQWTSNAPIWPSAIALTVDRTSGALFVGIQNNGIFRTIDGGNNWVAANTGIGNITPTKLIADNMGAIYALANGAIYKTIDAGDHWTNLNNGINGAPAWSSVLAVASSGTIYASAGGSGVYKSTNGGSDWTKVNSDLPNLNIESIAIDSAGTVYLSAYPFDVYKSVDGGAHWLTAGTGLPSSTPGVLFTDGTTVYAGTYFAGVYKTTDGGLHWIPTSVGLPPSHGIRSFVLSSPGTIYTAVGDQLNGFGIYRTSDGGAHWDPVNSGLTPMQMNSVSTIGSDASGNVFVAAREGGVLKYSDTAGTWQSINKGPFKPTRIKALLTDGIDTVYAASNTQGWAPSGGLGISKSINGASNWIEVDNDLTNLDVYSLAKDPAGVIYVSTYWFDIFKSSDSGIHWTKASKGLPYSSPTAIVIDGLSAYVGTYAYGVYKTADGGDNWTPAYNGLPTRRGVLALVVAATDTLFAAVNDQTGSEGIYKTVDGGAHWNALNNGLGNLNVKCFLIDSMGAVYAGTAGGLYRSANGGESWSAVTNGLPNIYISALAADSTGTIFAGSSNGVFKIASNESSWSSINSGLTDLYINALAVDTGDTLYAGTDSGVFTLKPPKSQTISAISFSPTTLVAGSTTTASAAATSGLMVSYSSTTPAVCSVYGSIVTGIAIGDCTIAADQAGNVSYKAANQVTQSITVSKGNQTVSFVAAPTIIAGKTSTVLATATSGLAVSFTSATPTVCSVSDNSVTGIAVGVCTISADQAGNSSYNAASQVILSTVVMAVANIPKFAYVANQGSNNVSVYTINQTTGALTVGTTVAAGLNPRSVTVDLLGRFAYAANSGSNNVSVYTINQSTGALTAGTAVAAGSGPWSVTVDPSGRFAYVANSGSSNISVYTINQTTGALTAGTLVASGTNPYSVTVDPSGRFAYVANFGSNNVSVYLIDQTTGALTAGTEVAAGSYPESVAVDPKGKFAYVANNGSNNVTVYSINQTTGALTAGTTMAAGTNPISVTVDPSGKFAYVANIHSNISVYTINQSTGALTAGTSVTAGTNPISITVDPSGKFSYVANLISNNVSAYTINQATGALNAGTTATAGIYPYSVTTTGGIAATAPGVPTNVKATAGNGQDTVSFTPPVSNGGSSITSYAVTANPGNISATGSSSPITVPVLTNSTAYTFTVTATNADGFTGPVATASTILNGLSVTLNGSGSGSVNSSPSGINITAGTSSNIFNSGSTVSLFQSASNGSQFSGWGGACTGTGGCNVLLTSLYQSVTATFDTLPSVRILGSSKLYELLQLTYDGATTGDVIQSKGMTFIENLTMDKSVSVTFKGGYDSTFSTQNSYTVLEGVLRVKQGRLVVNHLIIK